MTTKAAYTAFAKLNALLGDVTMYASIAEMPAELQSRILAACEDVQRETNDTSAFARAWIARLR